MNFTLKFISERRTRRDKEYPGHYEEAEKLVTFRRVVQDWSKSERSSHYQDSREQPPLVIAVVGIAYRGRNTVIPDK